MVAVVQLSFFSDPQHRAPAQLLQDWPTVATLAEAATLGGARVTVVQASAHTQQLSRDGIGYRFLPCDREPALLRGLIEELRPELLHVQGLGFAREVLSLAALAPDCPIVLQDRADRPPRRPWRWPLWRRALSAARGLMFCAHEQALPFQRRGLLRTGMRIYELPGSSCRFRPREQGEARRATGLAGDPCLLWVGHLDRNKDPLTVLDGLALAARQLPGLQLWCCFGRAPLLDEVRTRLAGDAQLAGRVHLLGPVPHARIETLMAAADFLVQGSHRESTGYSVLEALACGLPPLVTDIPSFRALTAQGAAGRLWSPGRAESLAEALLQLSAQAPGLRRATARACFEAQGSLDALGRKLAAAYTDLLRP
ncbi:MAG TPA: glycosyltransferase family 4 protein [Roseateles sp.]|nr:glycosyltransferase family 4 protein [Roseateles sp.]